MRHASSSTPDSGFMNWIVAAAATKNIANWPYGAARHGPGAGPARRQRCRWRAGLCGQCSRKNGTSPSRAVSYLRASDLVRAPPLRVVLAHLLRVRRGANGCADLELPMRPLDRRLGRAAVGLTPDQGDLGAD